MNKSNSVEHSSAERYSIKNNSLETIDKTVLSEQTKIQLSEIIGIENYFLSRIGLV